MKCILHFLATNPGPAIAGSVVTVLLVIIIIVVIVLVVLFLVYRYASTCRHHILQHILMHTLIINNTIIACPDYH